MSKNSSTNANNNTNNNVNNNVNNYDIKRIYELFDEIGCLTFATIDNGYPETRIAHLFAYDEGGLYLRTMTVKPFFEQMKKTPRLSICGMSASPNVTHGDNLLPIFDRGFTMRATGDVKEVPYEYIAEKGKSDDGFKMGHLDMDRYPDERAFVLYRFKGEYYDYDFDCETRSHKIIRHSFNFGDFPHEFRGMKINEKCISCGKCKEQCDSKVFRAISEVDDKYVIDNSKCDVCGECTLVCPVDAIDSYKS